MLFAIILQGKQSPGVPLADAVTDPSVGFDKNRPRVEAGLVLDIGENPARGGGIHAQHFPRETVNAFGVFSGVERRVAA